MQDINVVMSWLEGLTEDDWALYHSDSEVQNIAKAALELLENQEEVVRCKDCKHKVDTVDDYDNESKCPCYCSSDPYYSWVPDDDWFCAAAEPKSKQLAYADKDTAHYADAPGMMPAT